MPNTKKKTTSFQGNDAVTSSHETAIHPSIDFSHSPKIPKIAKQKKKKSKAKGIKKISQRQVLAWLCSIN